MEALEDSLSELRIKLMMLCPEKYHYGSRSRNAMLRGKEKGKPTTLGDNGFFICKECHGLFEHLSYVGEKKLGTKRDKESFDCCSEHGGRKKTATLQLKKEELAW